MGNWAARVYSVKNHHKDLLKDYCITGLEGLQLVSIPSQGYVYSHPEEDRIWGT